MKMNRNFWRFVALVMALATVFAFAACSGDEDGEKVTTEQPTNATQAPTEAPTEAPTRPTRETKSTEEPSTVPPTSEKGAELVAADGTVYHFTGYLPAEYRADDVIILNAGSYDLAKSKGIKKHEVSGITHYYIYADDDTTFGPRSELCMVFNVEVPEDGWYSMCIDMRMKDGASRGNMLMIDGGEPIMMNFQFVDADGNRSDAAAEAVRDPVTISAYMTGYAFYLTKGTHEFMNKLNPNNPKSFHFRNLFFAPFRTMDVSEMVYPEITDAMKAEIGEPAVTVTGAPAYGENTTEIKKGDEVLAYRTTNYMTYEFEVPEDAKYGLLVKAHIPENEKITTFVQVDHNVPEITTIDLTSKGDEEFGAIVKDGYAYFPLGSYNMDSKNAEGSAMKHTVKFYVKGENATSVAVNEIGVYKIGPKVELPAMPEIPMPGEDGPRTTFGLADFSSELPARFNDAIHVSASTLDEGSTNIGPSGKNHLIAAEGVAADAPSANCVVKLNNKGVDHYYLDPGNSSFKNQGLTSADAYMRFVIEVPTAGDYDVCLYLRVKDTNTRNNLFKVNDGTPASITLKFAAGDSVDNIRDLTDGAYLTGLTLKLNAGKNILTVTPGDGGSIHFRDFYLVKAN